MPVRLALLQIQSLPNVPKALIKTFTGSETEFDNLSLLLQQLKPQKIIDRVGKCQDKMIQPRHGLDVRIPRNVAAVGRQATEKGWEEAKLLP
jgi:hypothetical protein